MKEVTIEAKKAEQTMQPTVDQKLENAIRDLKVEHLTKLSASETKDGAFEELFAKLAAEYPGHIPLLMAKLEYLDGHPKRMDKLPDVIATANAILLSIDEDELALTLGRELDSEDGDAVKVSLIIRNRNLCDSAHF
jgi:tripeptidyl-peptidase II